MQVPLIALLAPALTLALSVALVRGAMSPAVRELFLDHPNQRSLHVAPVPRTGGLGFLPAALLGIAITGAAGVAAALAALLLVVSLVDDWRDVPFWARLLIHLAVAGVFVVTVLTGAQMVVGLFLAVSMAWMTNLYNFMDGADGLAGGMALIGFSTYAIAAWLAGDPAFALANVCVAAGAVAFLLYNFPPARVFMGDAGSVPLGFLAGALGLQGWAQGLWPVWFPAVVFAPFVVDATVTLLRRAARGERIWQAHRTHYYQRVILLGWSHRRTALAEYALMAVSAAVAVLAARGAWAIQALLLAGLAVLYFGAGVYVDRLWRRARK
jgi:UDP-GlcNAc:undecaprenyl-phosphate GlcNAc-1-phosphate transferase